MIPEYPPQISPIFAVRIGKTTTTLQAIPTASHMASMRLQRGGF